MLYDGLLTLDLPSRNVFFTGREEYLGRIDQGFRDEIGIQATQTLALCGLAGIGKTHIALEYAHRNYNNYQAVLWVNASTKDNFEFDMLTIARRLALTDPEEKDVSIMITAVHRWLKRLDSWLLVLDDVKDEQSLKDFIPSIEKGRVLITTQLNEISGITNIDVERMSESEGVLFLLRRSREIAPNSGDGQTLVATYPDARQIVEIMDGLPLALDQAGAFIEETLCGLAGYVTRYKMRSKELLEWRGEAYGPDDKSVKARWSISIDNMAKIPFALDVLHFCAFLNAEAIPEELILTGLHFFNPEASFDSPQIVEAIEKLCKFSLLRKTTRRIHDTDMDVLSIHRLMQEVLRVELDPDTKRQYAENTILAVSHAFPSIEFSSWDECQVYLPHAKICLGYIKDYRITSVDAAHLIHEAAYYSFERIQYHDVEAQYLLALQMLQDTLGKEDSDVAKILHNLALYYREQGQYSRAEELFRKAWRIRERELGKQHIHTAASLHQLGWIYNRLARYELAEKYLKRALEIRLKELPHEHQWIASSYNELGSLYRHTAQYDEAKKFLEDAFDIRIKLAHPRFAKTLVDLAWLYFEQGDLKSAEDPLLAALKIQNKSISPHHPHRAKTLSKLGLLYCASGRFDIAEQLHHQALQIRREILPPKHPDMAESYDSLGLLYYHRAREDDMKKRFEEARIQYDQAEKYFRDAITIRQEVFGETHPDTLQARNHLGLLHLARGEYEQAGQIFEATLQARKEMLGNKHPQVVTSLNHLAQLAIIQADYGKAEKLLLEAREVWNKLHIEHPQIARTLEILADLYVLLHRDEEAEALYEEVIPVYTKKLVPNHPDTIEILKKREALLRRKGDKSGALELQQPIEMLIRMLKKRAEHMRNKGDEVGAAELEQRFQVLQE